MSEATRPPWADRYVREKRLGDGGQGTTLLVRSTSTNERFALKELHAKQQREPGRRNRMRIEATTLEVLEHPCIPRVIEHNGGAYRDLDTPMFIVMEYAEGGTLTRRIKRGGPLRVDAALAVAERLLKALAYCHHQEVVHRDVKPDNIAFRTADSVDPVLLDFGLTFNWRHIDANATRSGEQLGNRFLHLPELLSGADRRDPRSDVTQCAGLLLYMLTGIEPVSLLDERGFAPHRRTDQHEPLVAIAPPSLLAYFDQAFQPRLGDRFQSAESARMALENLGSTGERIGRAASVAKRIRDRVLDDDVYIGETAAREIIELVRDGLTRAVKSAHTELAVPGTATRNAEVREGDSHLTWEMTAGLALDAGFRFQHLSHFVLRIAAREVWLTAEGALAPLVRAPVAGFAVSDEMVAAMTDVLMAGVEKAFDAALHARQPVPVVTPKLKRAVVDIVVAEHFNTLQDVGAPSVLLRLGTASRVLGETAIDACVPSWLHRTNPRPADHYRPTLAGVLASAQGDRASEFIRRVLAHWKAVAPLAQSKARIRSDQEEFKEFDLTFMCALMTLGRLNTGGGTGGGRDQPFDFGVPFRLMDILECETAQDLVALWERVG